MTLSYCVIIIVPNRVTVSLLFNYVHYFRMCNLIPVTEINVPGEAVSPQKKLHGQDLDTGQVHKIIC